MSDLPLSGLNTASEPVDPESLVGVSEKLGEGSYGSRKATLEALARALNEVAIDWDATPAGGAGGRDETWDLPAASVTGPDANGFYTVGSTAGAEAPSGIASVSFATASADSTAVIKTPPFSLSAIQGIYVIALPAAVTFSQFMTSLQGTPDFPGMGMFIWYGFNGNTTFVNNSFSNEAESGPSLSGVSFGQEVTVAFNGAGNIILTDPVNGVTQSSFSITDWGAPFRIVTLILTDNPVPAGISNVPIKIGTPASPAEFPAGVQPGQTLKVTGEGPLGDETLKVGDMVVVRGEEPHSVIPGVGRFSEMVDSAALDQAISSMNDAVAIAQSSAAKALKPDDLKTQWREIKWLFLDTPPSNPSDGDRALVGDNPTGDWIGFTYGEMVQYDLPSDSWNSVTVDTYTDWYFFSGGYGAAYTFRKYPIYQSNGIIHNPSGIPALWDSYWVAGDSTVEDRAAIFQASGWALVGSPLTAGMDIVQPYVLYKPGAWSYNNPTRCDRVVVHITGDWNMRSDIGGGLNSPAAREGAGTFVRVINKSASPATVTYDASKSVVISAGNDALFVHNTGNYNSYVPISVAGEILTDIVLDYLNTLSFPATGKVGKIYIARDTEKMYRWTGSGYSELSPVGGVQLNGEGKLDESIMPPSLGLEASVVTGADNFPDSMFPFLFAHTSRTYSMYDGQPVRLPRVDWGLTEIGGYVAGKQGIFVVRGYNNGTDPDVAKFTHSNNVYVSAFAAGDIIVFGTDDSTYSSDGGMLAVNIIPTRRPQTFPTLTLDNMHFGGYVVDPGYANYNLAPVYPLVYRIADASSINGIAEEGYLYIYPGHKTTAGTTGTSTMRFLSDAGKVWSRSKTDAAAWTAWTEENPDRTAANVVDADPTSLATIASSVDALRDALVAANLMEPGV